MLLDSKSTLIPKIKFELTFDDDVRKVVTIKAGDVIKCTYNRSGSKYIITGKVKEIKINFNASLGTTASSAYITIDGSDQYAGQVVYVQPSEVYDIVMITSTDEINNVVCSVDNEDQRIALIRKNVDTNAFEYSMDGLTWTPVNEEEAASKDYNQLQNLPTLEGKTIKGAMTYHGMGLASESDLSSVSSTVTTLTNTVTDIVNNQLPKKQDKLIAKSGSGISLIPSTETPGYVEIYADQTAPAWGQITGSIVNQTDLQQSLNAKQDEIKESAKLSSDLVDDTGKTHLFVTAEEKEAWNTKQGGLTAGNGIDATELSTNKKIQVINPLTDTEKAWLEDQLFNKNFVVSISASTGSSLNVFGAPDEIVFTLTAKYSGVLVDLLEVPTGWTKTTGATGTYTLTKNIVETIKGSDIVEIHSGEVSCKGGEDKYKTAADVVVKVFKPAYVVSSNNESIAAGDIASLLAQANTVTISDSANMNGEVTINTTGKHGHYVFYIVPKYSEIAVLQFGIDIVAAKVDLGNITVSNKDIGKYDYYRTEEAIGTDSLVVTVLGGK